MPGVGCGRDGPGLLTCDRVTKPGVTRENTITGWCEVGVVLGSEPQTHQPTVRNGVFRCCTTRGAGEVSTKPNTPQTASQPHPIFFCVDRMKGWLDIAPFCILFLPIYLLRQGGGPGNPGRWGDTCCHRDGCKVQVTTWSGRHAPRGGRYATP